jgi:hypothetical protein
MRKKRRLLDEYFFPGFYPTAEIQGIFGDSRARIIQLKRRQKKVRVAIVGRTPVCFTIGRSVEFEICLAQSLGFIWSWRSGESSARRVAR